MTSKIYKIECMCGCEKVYVGCTTRALSKRMAEHRYACKNQKVNGRLLYKHMLEVDPKLFLISLIEDCKDMTREQAKAREHHYIKQLDTVKNGFNNKYENPRCEHKRERSICKECDGACICEHKRIRNLCKECDGASICEHKRIRNQCKECDGVSICEHKRRRTRCKECFGGSICNHKRQRNLCKECDGASICEHSRRRNLCKECFGASICEHKRMRKQCKECNPAICETCNLTFAGKQSLKRHYKTKKHQNNL